MPFLPEDGGQCFICEKLFSREYLNIWKFNDGKHAVCDEDYANLQKNKIHLARQERKLF